MAPFPSLASPCQVSFYCDIALPFHRAAQLSSRQLSSYTDDSHCIFITARIVKHCSPRANLSGRWSPTLNFPRALKPTRGRGVHCRRYRH